MSVGQIRGHKGIRREPNRLHAQPMFGRIVKTIYGTILRHVYARRIRLPHTSGDSGGNGSLGHRE